MPPRNRPLSTAPEAPADPTGPFGADGAGTDRDPDTGRFTKGNRAALVVGHHSAQFWAEQAAARHEIETALIRDAGHEPNDAPAALRLAVEAIAQAALIERSAFTRLVQSGGPLTARGRSRRAFTVWMSAVDRLERGLRLVGVRRVPRPVKSVTEALMRAPVLGSRDDD